MQKEVLDLITPYLSYITNEQIEENYKNAKTYEELIDTVKKIASSIFDEEVKEEDKIKQVKALTNKELIESLNTLYKAFFNKLNLFNMEKLENNECIISNEITKIIIFKKMFEELNKNNKTQTVAQSFENILKISDKYTKINGILENYKNMTTKHINPYYEFLKLDEKISTDDSKIKKLLDSIKNDDNDLSKLINKIIIFSEEVISITGLLKEIMLPQELKIE
jgi:F0F1-type ATP synthase delta subunit